MSTYFNSIPSELNNIILSYLPFDDLLSTKDLISEWKSILTYSYPIQGITSDNWFQLYYTYKFLEQEFEYIIKNILNTDLEPEIIINKIKLEFPTIKIFPENNVQLRLLYLDLIRLQNNKLKLTIEKINHRNLIKAITGNDFDIFQYLQMTRVIIRKVNTVTQVNLMNIIESITSQDLFNQAIPQYSFENYIRQIKIKIN